MRSDDGAAERVTRLLAQGRGDPPSSGSVTPPDPLMGDDEAWPAEWAPAAEGSGPRWEVPGRAALAVVVLALVLAGVVAVVLLRGPSGGGTPVPLSGLPAAPAVSTSPLSPSPAASFAVVPGSASLAEGPAVRVYVVGQVRRPGVVSLSAGARVEDAVQAAGGAGPRADLAVMNLARRIVDGERIVVPRPGESVAPDPPVAGTGVDAGTGADAGAPGVPGTPLDLNSATVAQLDALPGVGPVIAGRIVAWRQENGRFARVEDLNEVQGIGDAIFARLRPMVRV